MSKEDRLFERPKVRFCQPSDSSFEKCETMNGEGILQDNNLDNKPRVRSIVTLDNSSKLEYKNGKLVSSAKSVIENRGTKKCSEIIQNGVSSSEACSTRRSPLSLHNEQQTIGKTEGPSVCENNLKKSSIVSKAPSQKSNQKNFPCGESAARASKSKENGPRRDSRSSEIVPRVKTGAIAKPNVCVSKITPRNFASKAIPSAAEKPVLKSVPGSSETVVSLPKNNISKMHRRKEEIPNKSSVCSARGVTSSTKTAVSCGLKTSKPGNKTWKTRTNSGPVKKTILRDINACSTNVYVGPGVARYNLQTLKGPPVGEKRTHIRPDVVSGEKLGRPEYNSIICTIEELRKVESEKFVTDVEHLPSVYRNLVNEKVSAALDFPPDEAIYKNLVDLSVSENQLPTRLTRSKDPEPRHRDIVPKLSDFFTPSYSEEYSSAIRIKPGSPEVISNWNAFVISDKIFGWKHDMDRFC